MPSKSIYVATNGKFSFFLWLYSIPSHTCVHTHTQVCAKSLQSCLTLYDTMDGSPSGSSVHGILPGNNNGADCGALFQGIFLTQESNLHLLCPPALARGGGFTTRATWKAYTLTHTDVSVCVCVCVNIYIYIYIYMHIYIHIFICSPTDG